MKQVGEILKKEREKQDLSLHEIGLSLKINTKILKALEDGDQKQLPAKTFLRGFVKSYAQYLKMNPQEVLAAFDQEHKQVQQEKSPGAAAAATQAQDKSITQMKPVEKTPFLKEFASSGRLTTLIVAALLLLMIIFVVQTMNKYQNEKMVAETTPHLPSDSTSPNSSMSTTATSTLLPSASPVMPTKIEASTTASTNGTSSTKTVDSSSPQITAAPSPSNPTSPAASALPTAKPTTPSASTLPPSHTITPPATTPAPARPTPTTAVAVSAPTATTSATAAHVTKPAATPAMIAKPSTTPAATAAGTATANAMASASTPVPTSSTPPPAAAPAAPVKPKSSTVLVEALNKVVIKYVVDGKNETLTLNPGQVHTFKGSKPGLILEISDGGAVNLIVNGRDKGVPGEMGKPVKLTY